MRACAGCGQALDSLEPDEFCEDCHAAEARRWQALAVWQASAWTPPVKP